MSKKANENKAIGDECKLVSIIIATYKRPELLQACINSIRNCKNAESEPFEVIVVDDGGGLSKDVEKDFNDLNIQWIRLKENMGQPGAQAEAVKYASGEIFAFLDDDAEVCDTWIKSIRDFFKKYPSISAILGRIEPFDTKKLLARTRQEIYDKRHRQYTNPKWCKALKEKYKLNIYDDIPLSDHVSGGCFAILRSVLDEIGGFRQDMKLGSDELMSKRLLESKNAIGYCAEMRIFHHHNTSFRALFKMVYNDGYDHVRIVYELSEKTPKLGTKLVANLLLSPFKIVDFPEILHSDRFIVRAYLIYTAIRFVNGLGQIAAYNKILRDKSKKTKIG